ncbi:MAG TPA: radical SAM protein, partial [Labilithrix sp.]|nr:radical SAM protein [Labilithrix sp.]
MATNANAQPLPLALMPEEWAKELVRLGGRAFHGKQVFRWIHARGVTDPSKMSDLPAPLRTKLAESGLRSVMDIVSERRATDDTRKLLVSLGDGANVETVLIPRVAGGRSSLPSPLDEDADAAAAVEDEDDPPADDGPIPVTQCISTQVGCAMGCVFCASGVAGLKRHMRADEIVAQVLVGRSRLDEREQLRNVVLMGMGEPLHNYDATVRALRLLTHPDGI